MYVDTGYGIGRNLAAGNGTIGNGVAGDHIGSNGADQVKVYGLSIYHLDKTSVGWTSVYVKGDLASTRCLVIQKVGGAKTIAGHL